ncbi:hypothetical protein AKJ64_02450 [candidate division MSBL1 archaeon SCGC-AAA259E17]|uniref:Uncharacterized protein n=1 Tax=candidate division MSBL1 archaeon SCGC-AAA259E17 TaxID=1698263 RepID=A0A133UEP1_9EURY|nr:hypothetical protein AKJ64_02450 [candidate division MSBL1 archaeon SCGC-AAA259E17]
MESRERILEALAHRPPDRCPNYIWINDDTMNNLLNHLGVSSAKEAKETLNVDKWHEINLNVSPPKTAREKINSLVPTKYNELYLGYTPRGGGVSLQRTLPFGTPQEELYLFWFYRGFFDWSTFRSPFVGPPSHSPGYGGGGGFVIGPSNALIKEIPPENIVALYEYTNNGK